MVLFNAERCVNTVFLLLIIPFKGAAGDIAMDGVKTEGLGDVKKDQNEQ